MTTDARSLLFTPGHKGEMLKSAFESQADALVLDLEDGVPPGEKECARTNVGRVVSEHGSAVNGKPLFVRIAGGETDVESLEPQGEGPYGYFVPKVTNGDAIERFVASLEGADSQSILVPMIENGAGVINAESIAGVDRVEALAFGGEDYVTAVGARPTDDGHQTQYACQRLVAVADAFDVDVIDTVYTDLSDAAGLEAATKRAVELGFDGKLALHPSQLEVIHRVFRPSGEEIAWAEQVVAAVGEGNGGETGAVRVDGQMVDTPLVKRARTILSRTSLAEENRE